MIDYSELVTSKFNVILDVTNLSSPNEKIRALLFSVIKEYFALAEDRIHVFTVDPRATLYGYKLNTQRVQQFIDFLKCDELSFNMVKQNERTILIFE